MLKITFSKYVAKPFFHSTKLRLKPDFIYSVKRPYSLLKQSPLFINCIYLNTFLFACHI